jgi:N-acetylmuramoyl-L-alanine amidase
MKILIDNGHGENTPGKRSPDGKFREYLYTREIAERVVMKLKSLGYDAEQIVREYIDVPLKERVRRVNDICREVGKHNVLFISIHCNAAGDGSHWRKAKGWSAFTSKGYTRSDELAEYLYRSAERNFVNQKIRYDKVDHDSDWEENFYVLKNTLCTAVLTENFFQDNHDDVNYLLSADGRLAVINTHVEGIVNFINNK